MTRTDAMRLSMNKSRSPIKLPSPHTGQRHLIDGERRFNVACMGRRFGKSAFGVNRLVKYGYCQNKPVAWFAPQYKFLDEAWRETKSRLFSVIINTDKQQHRLELRGGGSIDFWTLDNPDAGRSRKYALAIIDEAAMALNLEEAWVAAIRPTLADLQGKAWFLSTPKGDNYFKKLFDRAQNDSTWARWQMPTSTNPYIRTDEIAEMEKDMPRIVFEQEILAQFVDMTGALMKREWIRHGGSVSGDIVIGVDLAISSKTYADYTCCAVMSRNSSGMISLLGAKRIQAPFHSVVQFIVEMANKWKPGRIAIEAVQYQMAVVQELWRTTTLNVIPVYPDKDKLTRFLPLLSRYEHGAVEHMHGLDPWVEEELLTFPISEHDDLIDAMSYAFAALPSVEKPDYSQGGISQRFSI